MEMESMARTRKKSSEPTPQPAYAGRLAASIAGLVTVQSSAELAQRVAVIAPEVDELEAVRARATEPEGALEEYPADALTERVRELEAECESWASRLAAMKASLDTVTDQVA